jgi:multicomponent Na+:H+ antiporter subunit B
MVSLILATAARVVQPLLLLFSIFVLVRGHNAPGGGFAGGLVAAIAFTLIVIAYDAEMARRSLRVDPRHVFAVGLLVAGAERRCRAGPRRRVPRGASSSTSRPSPGVGSS